MTRSHAGWKHEVTLHGQRIGDAWDSREAAQAFADGFHETAGVMPDVGATRERSRRLVDASYLDAAASSGRVTGEMMKRRGDLSGVGKILRAVCALGDRIIGAIRKASAEQIASRERLADMMLQRGAGFLRAALDEGTPRTIVTDPGGPDRPRVVTFTPPVANQGAEAPPSSRRRPGPTTPPGGPANDDKPPPRRPRK